MALSELGHSPQKIPPEGGEEVRGKVSVPKNNHLELEIEKEREHAYSEKISSVREIQDYLECTLEATTKKVNSDKTNLATEIARHQSTIVTMWRI
ncbi:hypothetical protein H5410_035039 [Solanum commersonii]|uniref:Uncharacterized protein n=1 Tax=Solanum commersonii TaxID=4109 RepID=A0A9J5Y1S6_SOLCO|nr:hypothetical protein H5410_035039 [Solanum commersonii]